MVAIVSDSDWELLSESKWHAKSCNGRFYAARTKDGQEQYMHRLLLGFPAEVDHRNGNTLDNQRSNLRPSNRTQQGRNQHRKRSGCSADHIGIYQRPNGRWSAQITVAYKNINLGTFDTQEEALAARRAGASKHYGADRHEDNPAQHRPQRRASQPL